MASDSKLVVLLKLDGTEFGKGISQAQADMAKFGAVLSGVGVAGLAAVKFAADFQDSTIKAARAAGMTSASFSSLSYAAGLGGVSVQDLGKNLVKLQNPSETATRAFKDMGISTTDASGKLKDQSELLSEFSDRLSQITDPVTKTQAAVRVFGEEGAKMVSVLEGGSKALEQARQEAAAFGQVVSEQAGKNAETFNDNIAKVTMGLSGLRNVVAESTIAFINQSGALEAIQGVLKGAIEYWRGLSDSTKNVIISVVAGIAAFGGLLLALSAVAAILPAIAAGFTIMLGPVGIVIAALGLLVAGTIALNRAQNAQLIAAQDAEKQAAKNQAQWKEEANALEALKGKTKLTGTEQEKLASVKDHVRKQAAALGQQINVETMSLQDLINKTREYQALQKAEQFKAQSKQAVELYKQYTKNTQAIDENRMAYEAAAKSGGGQIYRASIQDLTDKNKKLEAQMAAVGQAIADNNEIEKAAVNTAIQFSNATVAIDHSWKYATQSLDGFNNAMAAFKRDTSADLISGRLAFEEYSHGTEKSIQRIKNVIATANLAGAVAGAATQVIKPFGELTETIAKGIEYDSQVAQRNFDVVARRAEEAYNAQREALEQSEAAKIAALEASYDSQISALENGENQKNAIAQRAADERLLIANTEYERAKAAAEAAFQAQLQADADNYALKMEQLDEQALDREQRDLTTTIMEEDKRLLKEQREREHEQTLANLAKEYAGKQKDIDTDLKATQKANTEKNKAEIEALTAAKAEALTKAEEDKNAKMKALDVARAAEEKALEKQRLETQYKAQLDAFHATKAVKMAEIIASGIAAAAAAFAALAPIPFVGPVLGAAAAGVILATTGMRAGQLSSQEPIKPAGLLEDGGVIGGSVTHAQGGIPANVESGEMFIDKNRTAKMLEAIDSGFAGGGGGIHITFQAGAIQGDIRDEKTLTTLADRLGRLVSRRMVFA